MRGKQVSCERKIRAKGSSTSNAENYVSVRIKEPQTYGRLKSLYGFFSTMYVQNLMGKRKSDQKLRV